MKGINFPHKVKIGKQRWPPWEIPISDWLEFV